MPATVEAVVDEPALDDEPPEVDLGAPLRPGRARRRLLIALALLAGVAAGVGYGRIGRLPNVSSPIAAILVGAILVVLGGLRFWPTVLFIFLTRSSVDMFKTDIGRNGLDPSTVTGVGFIALGWAWLYVQHREGQLYKVSRSAIALVVVAGAALLSVPGSRMPIFSFGSALKLVTVATMALVLEQLFRREPARIRTLIWVLYASTVVPISAALSQLARGGDRTSEFDALRRVRGTFAHPNPFAVWLAMIVVVAIAVLPYARGRLRFASGLVILAGIGVILITYSRAGAISLAAGIGMIGLLQSRKLLAVMVVAGASVVLLVPSVRERFTEVLTAKKEVPEGQAQIGDSSSLSWRLRYWGEILPYTWSSPVTGIGSEMVRNTHPTRFDPHNSFIEALVEWGVLGLAALLGFIACVVADLRVAFRRHRRKDFRRGLVVGAAAAFTAWFVALPSENSLVGVVTWWYLLVPVCWATAAAARPGGSRAAE